MLILEIEGVKKLQSANFKNGPVAQMLECHTLHKDRSQGNNGFVPVATLISHCYDVIISVTARLGHGKRDIAWKSSAEDVVRVRGGGNLEFDKWNNRRRMIMETLSQPFDWDPKVPEQEPRACLFLDRFTIISTIQYMTNAGRLVLDTDPSDAIGRSIFDYIDAKDQAEVRKAIQNVKSSEAVMHIRFRWRKNGGADDDSEDTPAEPGIPCEAVLVASCDTLLCIIRKRNL